MAVIRYLRRVSKYAQIISNCSKDKTLKSVRLKIVYFFMKF